MNHSHNNVCVSIRLPFNQNYPFGFFLAMSMQFVMLSCMSIIAGCAIALAVGSFLYGIAMTKCIKGSLFAINRGARAKKGRHLEQIIEFIRFHSTAKQLSRISGE